MEVKKEPCRVLQENRRAGSVRRSSGFVNLERDEKTPLREQGRERKSQHFSPVLKDRAMMRAHSISVKKERTKSRLREREIESRERLCKELKRIETGVDCSDILKNLMPLVEKTEKEYKFFPVKMVRNIIKECQEGITDELVFKIRNLTENWLIFGDKFMEEAEKITVKKLMELKKAKYFLEEEESVLQAFVLILADLEPEVKIERNGLEFEGTLKLVLSNPGKIVQLVRKFPVLLKNQEISEESICMAKELVKDITSITGIAWDILNMLKLTFNLFELFKIHEYEQTELKTQISKTKIKMKKLKNAAGKIEEKIITLDKEENKEKIPDIDFIINEQYPSIFNEPTELCVDLNEGEIDSKEKFEFKAKFLYKFYSKFRGKQFSRHPFSVDILQQESQTCNVSRNFTPIHFEGKPNMTPRINNPVLKRKRQNSENLKKMRRHSEKYLVKAKK